jgi:hypothetical protein
VVVEINISIVEINVSIVEINVWITERFFDNHYICDSNSRTCQGRSNEKTELSLPTDDVSARVAVLFAK